MSSTYKQLSCVRCVTLDLHVQSLDSEPKGRSQISLNIRPFYISYGPIMEQAVLISSVPSWEVLKHAKCPGVRAKEEGVTLKDAFSSGSKIFFWSFKYLSTSFWGDESWDYLACPRHSS